ncbi:MAG: bifunctional (p)ppGpp synthetase/guanosine-3',5'-bis(diphosphate) 3'-pyrophosphohydrolase [Rhodobacteraceae bacterium]|nr:MAG: bifunctional (p)ppGpp synthetase/guanosine-3',5'-bis(diphosphate) 3'-pyrophosphohydrolase [Paracoccaceae bacterium]
MIRQFELVERVRAYNPNTDEALLNRAYVYGARAHATQTRASGEPYFGHPLEVAAILTDLQLDDATIVTALLHDTIEDTTATRDEIAGLFGEEIAALVDGVTKLTRLELTSKESAQAENFRKLLVAMSRDVRVLLVKLADRLHNMRTLEALRPDKRQRIARETMEIFAPLAGRMGMQKMREELEDLAFDVLNPDARNAIMRRFLKLKKETGDLIPEIVRAIEEALYEDHVPAAVSGREKRPYSIWRKMEEKQVGFSQLSDIYAFRLITEREEDCYRALGSVHRRWRVVPERMKDYISGPKSNGYRSIHTTVSGPRAMRVEVQIRTREMHEVAESGVAAHWAYRDGERAHNPFAVDPFTWLRDLVDRIEKGDQPQEFLEHVKLDMFYDQVFCFTPKGDVIPLPRGATPIDFAYAIHTRVGDSCVGAKIDGRRAPLWTRLRNGQAVEIIRADAQRPSPVWMDMAVTGRARSAIRRALREDARDENVRLGREIARQAFARRNREMTEKALETAARKLGRQNAEDLLEAVGAGELSGRRIVETLYPALAEENATPRIEAGAPTVRGVRKGLAIRFGQCCHPIPGERVIGIRENGGVTVHVIDCETLAAHEQDLDRWLDLRWDEDAALFATHVARIDLTVANEPGALAALCTLIAERKANIDYLSTAERTPDFHRMVMDLEVRDAKHLSGILTALEAQPIVSAATRRRGVSA